MVKAVDRKAEEARAERVDVQLRLRDEEARKPRVSRVEINAILPPRCSDNPA